MLETNLKRKWPAPPVFNIPTPSSSSSTPQLSVPINLETKTLKELEKLFLAHAVEAEPLYAELASRLQKHKGRVNDHVFNAIVALDMPFLAGKQIPSDAAEQIALLQKISTINFDRKLQVQMEKEGRKCLTSDEFFDWLEMDDEEDCRRG